MRKLISILLLLLCATLVFAGKVTTLNDLLRPYSLAVDGGQMYIVDNLTIKLYSLKDYKCIKTIGKKGIGPGEFPFSPQVNLFPDVLFVNSWGKIIIFNRNGDYSDEKRLSFPISYFVYQMLPLGKDAFIGPRSQIAKREIVFTIFDKNLNAVNEISSGLPNLPPIAPPGGGPMVDLDIIGDCWNYVVYKDKIIMADTRKGFYFSVFDFKGKKLYEINHQYNKIEVSTEDKEMYWKRLKSTRDWEISKNYFKVFFRDDFPAFACFQVSDDKIYAYTYQKKEGKFEIVVMDINGKILKSSYVGNSFPDTLMFKNHFSINSNKIYFLKENSETEDWDLYIDKIE